jgi:dTDP-glucose pyrophosphorylase
MSVQNKIHELKIQKSDSMIKALKQMDLIKKKLLLVFDSNNFVNILSIGDIQRAILNNLPLETSIKKILRVNTKIASAKDSFDSIKKTMYNYRIECMPVVDENNSLVDVYFWEDVFSPEIKLRTENLNLPIVIMAGGEGNRLKPLTNVIPKPLIPIGEKTVIEEIMDRFVDVGCDNFFLSVNYKAATIKHYFSQLQSNSYKIKYFQEEKPLGTVGSLFLIKDQIKTTFFISNCDIIINEDYSEILKYHRENKNELTIISALKHYPIPYGTLETKKNGVLAELKEKPELTFQINSGMYILEPHLMKEIPENKFFHITQLIENIQKRKGRVGVFPVSEGSWKDIGDWEEYLKHI